MNLNRRKKTVEKFMLTLSKELHRVYSPRRSLGTYIILYDVSQMMATKSSFLG